MIKGGDPNYLLNNKAYRKAQKRLLKNGNKLAGYLTQQVK